MTLGSTIILTLIALFRWLATTSEKKRLSVPFIARAKENQSRVHIISVSMRRPARGDTVQIINFAQTRRQRWVWWAI